MNTSSEYQGLRWLKCDLHVHTPEDARHWTDPDFRLPSPRSEQDLQEKARRFLHSCHELDLDCIAVTDHNFSTESDHRKWFLTHVIEQNQTVAEEVDRPPLIIFPGFELDIRYHIVCLFTPINKGKDLQLLSDTLTGMGLPPNERVISGNPQQPKHHGQCWSLREVLDKVQNELGGIVIAAHAFTNDGICNDTANIDDFVHNPDLYAIEISAWPPNNKAKSVLDGSNTSWNRPAPHYPPAAIRSSDGKHFGESSDTDSNVIGGRFAWIKMSQPSIEALRQAFLDPESRICLEHEPPSADHTHVKSIHISGSRFLKDQTVALSHHLTCLIGGRGSGKSMFFESIRLGLRGEISFKDADEKDHVAARQVKRLRGTFTNNTKIKLDVFHGGLNDRFVVDNSGQPARIDSREVDDPPTVFRRLNTLIFSQEEITQLADRQKSLLDFIDSLASDRLEPHRAKAREIIDHLKAARQIDEKVKRIDGELTVLKQEVSEFARQLDAKTQVQEELKHHRVAQEAQRYLDSVTAKASETIKQMKELAEGLEVGPTLLGEQIKTFPESAFFTQVEEKTGMAYCKLAETLRSAVATFQNTIDLALAKNPNWEKMHSTIQQAEENFKTACDEKDLTPQEAERMRETEALHRTKQVALDAKRTEYKNAQKQRPDIKKLLKRLTTCWGRETKARWEILDDILSSDTMPHTQNDKPILNVSLAFAGDRKTFLKIWRELAPDRRTAAGRTWDRYARDADENNIGDQLFDAFQESVAEAKRCFGNPVQWLEANWDKPDALPPIVQDYLDDIKRVKEEKPVKWFEVLVARIPDAADLTLLRSDDTEAGSFQKNDLSTGQKNTAILSLLLARGNGPVLIDQPEDELDSEFLFRELVPMFRKAKLQRQMIIVTHNANIPVNADAELVYALNAEGGKGICRAQGGLDCSDVTRAVLDIMEGSEEAFRRRKEKYHF